MRQLLVRNVDRLCAAKRLRSVAPVSGLRGNVDIRLSAIAGFRVLWFFQHSAGLLRIARRRQHRRQGMQGALEFVAISLAQRRIPGSVQHPVQFIQVHIDTEPFGGLHPTSPSSSRNRFVSGYPRTSLIDRFGT